MKKDAPKLILLSRVLKNKNRRKKDLVIIVELAFLYLDWRTIKKPAAILKYIAPLCPNLLKK